MCRIKLLCSLRTLAGCLLQRDDSLRCASRKMLVKQTKIARESRRSKLFADVDQRTEENCQNVGRTEACLQRHQSTDLCAHGIDPAPGLKFRQFLPDVSHTSTVLPRNTPDLCFIVSHQLWASTQRSVCFLLRKS